MKALHVLGKCVFYKSRCYITPGGKQTTVQYYFIHQQCDRNQGLNEPQMKGRLRNRAETELSASKCSHGVSAEQMVPNSRLFFSQPKLCRQNSDSFLAACYFPLYPANANRMVTLQGREKTNHHLHMGVNCVGMISCLATVHTETRQAAQVTAWFSHTSLPHLSKLCAFVCIRPCPSWLSFSNYPLLLCVTCLSGQTLICTRMTNTEIIFLSVGAPKFQMTSLFLFFK